jgi:ABC-type phosphate/phosphonate transport system permease subunit
VAVAVVFSILAAVNLVETAALAMVVLRLLDLKMD